MGIEDIQISEELETNAPSIKYSGNEGPKSPQEEQIIMQQQMQEMDRIQNQEAGDEEMMMADSLLQEEYLKYVFEMEEQGLQPMSFREFRDQIMSEAQMSSAQTMAPRQMAAYGGIMGIDGRRQYGLGSKFKKFVRKIIPNEVAKVAEVAAPFVAPFNPIAAGLMSGIGGFDRTGRIGSSIKSGLMNYGMGQLARGVGGGMDNLQGMSLKVPGGSSSGFGQYFSSPMQSSGGIGKMFSDKFSTSGGSMVPGADPTGLYAEGLATGVPSDPTGLYAEGLTGGGKTIADIGANTIKAQSKAFKIADLPGLVKKNLMAAGLGNNLMTGLLVGGLGAGALMGNMTEEEVKDMSGGEGMDVEGIRTEVLTAMKDPTGEALKAIRIKYPFLGTQRSKDVSGKAMGGRIGYMGGGMTMGDPRMMMPQSRMPMMAPQSRMPAAEGGLMDLGGMEKDYRAEGGFVPIGKAEKADDVPARLSVNEFVFTADAVRNAGGGDIDKGAEVMENMMKNLEQGGQVSEESQGMQGARDMFATSQRLSEVI